MRLRTLPAAAALVIALSLTACGRPATNDGAPPTASTSTGTSSAPPSPPVSSPEPGDQRAAGTVVRFSAGSTSVDVTIGEDNPAVRDFLSMLPLTLTLEEFNGREKIANLPRKLAYEGSPGSDPEDGDLIYYIPWGNIGFYYNTDGVGYSDQTIHLGTYDATLNKLELLESQEVTVDVVR
ncbi:cyclophilin-like fold protein [Nonomuraea sp. NPDC004186]|uniref:cyclophilin-like fold protein n=1 Tax=Nonomuraea sp. NPDC049625 TaxID=3155775 RepID=UPI00343ACABA